MGNNNLKSLATMAKQRLKEGHYTKEMAKTIINKNKANNYFYNNALSIKKKGYKAEFVTIELHDEKFEKKVCNLLASEELLCNPIGKLVDKTYYQTLSDYEKQFYILSLCEKYNKVREKYFEAEQLIS